MIFLSILIWLFISWFILFGTMVILCLNALLVISHTCHRGSTSHQSRLFGRLSTGLGVVVLINHVTRAKLIHAISVKQYPID